MPLITLNNNHTLPGVYIWRKTPCPENHSPIVHIGSAKRGEGLVGRLFNNNDKTIAFRAILNSKASLACDLIHVDQEDDAVGNAERAYINTHACLWRRLPELNGLQGAGGGRLSKFQLTTAVQNELSLVTGAIDPTPTPNRAVARDWLHGLCQSHLRDALFCTLFAEAGGRGDAMAYWVVPRPRDNNLNKDYLLKSGEQFHTWLNGRWTACARPPLG